MSWMTTSTSPQSARAVPAAVPASVLGAVLTAVLTVAFVTAAARPVRADATLFYGVSMTPSSRSVRGFAVGMGLVIVAFEFEYANTREDAAERAPGLKTGMGNVLLQTPVPIFGIQPYFTTGGGYYRETLDASEESGFGTNAGGGAKISLAGPLRLRVDYRVFRLRSGALVSPAHRLYAGVNLNF